MLKMLVVDDDKFERDGVKFLIEKYSLDLEISEADSGESALAYMESNDIDILFSDIRMKGMDGLQLAAKVRELDKPVKVIFMSAYGEFEYAQRAIDLNAIRYILKPVQVSEFIKVVSQVIQLCEQELKSKAQQERMAEAYRKEVRYEKQKLLTDLILGKAEVANEDKELSMPITGFDGNCYVRMLILDSRSRFFDRLDPDLERQLAEKVRRGFDFIHLNEFQGLLLVEAFADESLEALTELGQQLIRWFQDKYGREICIVISGLVDDVKQLYKEYHAMETMLENKFFFDEGTVLLSNRTSFATGDVAAAVNDALEELTLNIQRSRYDIARLRFEQLFDALQDSDHYSVIYVKYVCSDIVKAIFDASAKKNTDKFKMNLEHIYRTTKLNDLRKVVLSILGENESSGGTGVEAMPKAIEEVVRIIESEYNTDLSLESLAERIYLSPSYLSYLFKKQKGISINKFITLYRMERAKELLRSSNRKIVDIGLDVGYSNFPYFSSLFKNHYGKTPSQFREEA
ncbi:response regulator [Paenibacillus alginolyticus]|uniref:response regulator n=1 Tax=Paenibacillus alginolyticus TaxID=59839 RepID=UPI00040B5E79|nr:response regulator [Paenibacillus alginolyticus]MCY9670094.1 response regulator [Paenibacillus alginolyticus]